MLRTRLAVGAVLVALVVGMLVVDERLAPWYPFLLLFFLGLALASCFELLNLLDAAWRPSASLCGGGIAAGVAANWLAHPQPWAYVLAAFAALVLAAFLVEMATFREPGTSVLRIALAVWVVAYLGLLPSFFAQLRWLGLPSEPDRGTAALALAVFVPKC